MFTPDKANDLSAGTLYAMKVTQTSTKSVGGGMFDVEWVSLGHATNAEIKALMTKGDGTLIQFTDMFEIGTKTGDAYDFTCATGFKATVVNDGAMCLKLKTGMAKAASRFETRIYAAYVGASSQWRKLEGITYSKIRKEMYFELQEILNMEGGTTVIAFASSLIGASDALGHGPVGGSRRMDDSRLSRRWWFNA